MKILDILSEAPITDWQVDSDFDQNEQLMKSRRTDYRDDLEHYNKSDIAAIKNPNTIERIKDTFSNCPYNFNLYFVHDSQPDYDSFLQKGKVDQEWILKTFGDDIANRIVQWHNPNAINIIMTNNLSDENKINLKSPWMIAHRIAHSMIRTRYSNQFNLFLEFIKKILRVAYNIRFHSSNSEFGRIMNDDTIQIIGKLLGLRIATMNSARSGKLNDYHEWFYETFAQYIITGKITLNPLPDKLDAYGLTRNPKQRYAVQEAWRRFPNLMEKAFDEALKEAVGSFFVM